MSNLEREYKPRPSIVPFHDSHCQVKALCGPVGSSKTTAAAFEFFFMCTESVVPVHGLVVRESYRQLRDSTRRTVLEWFGGVSEYMRGDEQLRLTIPNCYGDEITHELDFRHCRRPEEVSNLLSTEYAFIWLEEPAPAYQMEGGVVGAGLPKELFSAALMRQRQKDMHRLNIVLTFNPPSKFHWLYEQFFTGTTEELAAKDFALFRSPPFENAVNLPAGYYEKLLDQLKDEDLVRRFVMGEVVTLYPGRRVYPEFYEQVHFDESLNPMPNVPLVLAFDFGLTPCVLIAQVLPNGRLLIYRELQLWSAGIEKLSEELRSLLKNEFPAFQQWRCWADPAGAQRAQTDERTCFQVLAANGFQCAPGAESIAGRQEAVIQRTQRFIDGKPAIQIDKTRCPILMEGLLGGYRFGKSHDDQVSKHPLKNKFSHSADCLGYLCSGEFSIVDGTAPRAAQRDEQRLPKYDPFKRVSSGRRGTWMSR